MHHSQDERSTGRVVEDTRITADVRDNLRKEPIYKFSDVHVQTFNGVVRLSGFVNSEDQKRRAGKLAQQTPGVTQVMNNISMKPAVTPTPQVPATPTARTNNLNQP